MSVNSYSELRSHLGHDIEIGSYVTKYGDIANVAIECMDCSEVLLDFDTPGEGVTESQYADDITREDV